MTRPLALLALLALAGCGLTPQDLGITGPGTNKTAVVSHVEEADPDAVNQPPGLPGAFGAQYSPSMEPQGGKDADDKFFGYN